jgi:hypothetical protein
VLWGKEKLIRWRHFYDPAYIHYGHTIANVPDDTQIMRNKQVSQLQLFLEIQQ